MRRLTLFSLLLAICALADTAPALADKRGVKIEGKDPAQYVSEQVGKSWAVVIGIDEYEHVRPLKYAVADAKAVAQTLRQRGFHVAELYDKRADRRNILGELGDRLVDRVGENDRVLIFYSGHGETKQPRGGKEMGFLLPVGAEADKLAETAIPMSVIRDLAEALPSKHVLFLVDVCYGGIAGTQFKSVLKYDEAYLREITRERGRQLITAGGPKQEALEGPEWGHSVFTYYLLEGLNKGLADLDGDGIIPASELHTYLNRRVFDAAQSKGHKQRPEMWKLANEPGEFVFFTSARGASGGHLSARPDVNTTPGPSAALSQAEQELAALQEQERQVEEEARQVDLQRQIKEKKHQIEERKKKIELAKAQPYSLPQQTGREITGKDGAPMVLVPEGEFLYGDDKQRKSLSAFYMDKYEVTTAQYAKFMAATGRNKPQNWETSLPVSHGQKPVIGVSWYDVDAYCQYYGKRLPTEQEWEKAARGTDGRKYPWGDEVPTRRHGNFDREFIFKHYGALVNVGTLEDGKSPYGIYDLAGNAWEWTSSDTKDYKGQNQKEVRGGTWGIDRPEWLRSSERSGFEPSGTDHNDFLGFRCVQDAS